MFSVLMSNHMRNTCCGCLLIGNFQAKFPSAPETSLCWVKLHQQKAHPKHLDPGLDPRLEAACQQGHPFPKLTVWDRCFPPSRNTFGFPRPEQRKGTAIADGTLDPEQLMGITVCTPALYTFFWRLWYQHLSQVC